MVLRTQNYKIVQIRFWYAMNSRADFVYQRSLTRAEVYGKHINLSQEHDKLGSGAKRLRECKQAASFKKHRELLRCEHQRNGNRTRRM
jgi:hypothetical protein